MPVGTTLAHLVDEFLATLYQHGIVVDRPTVEEEMRDRIADIAERLGVTPETVLREHAGPGWAQAMAADVIDHVRDERLVAAVEPPDDRPTRIAC